jgi:hypothetical protein
LGSLLALAIFVICNCAGYLIVTFVAPFLMVADSEVVVLSPDAPVSAAPTQANVVTFSTPTATSEAILPTPTALLPTGTPSRDGAPTLPATPIPLLPTVTPAPPTHTPSPTATISPTPTPTFISPSPTVQTRTNRVASRRQTADISQLEILSHQSYVDSLGWHHIVGEVQNNSDTPMEFVEVVAKLYDETNEVIGVKLTFTTPDVIFPGGKAPFDVITLRPSQWQRIRKYELQVKGDLAQNLIDQRLVLLNQNSYIQNGFLYVTGEVHNTGVSPALVKLIVTLYDVNRQVINTNWSYADLGIIPVDHTSPFQVKIAHTTDPNNFSYQIQIEEEAIDAELDLDGTN